MTFQKPILFIFFHFMVGSSLLAQNDTLILKKTGILLPNKKEKVKKEKVRFIAIDTSKPYNPRVAIIRSAILPGWGQFTNKKYWKMPIVYGALGTTAYIFFRNINQFKEANNAFKNAIDRDTSNDKFIPEPYYSVRNNPDRIKSFRNEVRQNIDYSVLFFIAFWGLNVADAAVDAHLKTFDVSDNLSLQIKPGYSPLANTNGVSLVFDIHSKAAKGRK